MDIQQLSDHVEIGQLLQLYFRGLDRLDYELIRSCFFDNASIDLTPFFKGNPDGFVDYVKGPGLGGFARTFHFGGNSLIELDGDIAHTEIYALSMGDTADEHESAGAFSVTWLRYLDRFERRNGEWRIADRRAAVDWLRIDTAGMWADLPAEAKGRRDRSDPVYAR